MLDASALAGRLVQLRGHYPQSDPEMVADVVRTVLTTMRGDLTAKDASLLAEVEELAKTVANARAEIAALEADDINASHIPSATDELDAIVEHTAKATDSILECCEKLDLVAPKLSGDDAQILQDVTTRIYEACSFQDITGQRITKIVHTLKAIETKVAQIISVFQLDDWGNRAVTAPAGAAIDPASLLNGPQLPTNAMDQSDIDALLASFD